MDKDRRVSLETIRGQFVYSVGTLHTTIREELKMGKICAKFVPRVKIRKKDTVMRAGMFELINSDPAVLDVLVTCVES